MRDEEGSTFHVVDLRICVRKEGGVRRIRTRSTGRFRLYLRY